MSAKTEMLTASSRYVQPAVGRQMGTIISCIPGKLAYFEDEDGRYILERKS
jgi:hypothetical protein